MNLKATPQDEATLDNQLDAIRHQIMATQYLNHELKKELDEMNECMQTLGLLKEKMTCFENKENEASNSLVFNRASIFIFKPWTYFDDLFQT